MNTSIATAARIGRKTLLAMGIAALATSAVAQTVPDDTLPAASLDLPANLQIFGKADPNVRKPTAIVNDVVITGTDVDQRMALVIAINDIKIDGEERDRLRLQILRTLIDETLEIQEAKANKVEVSKDEIDQSFNRVAKNFKRTPEQMRAWLRQIGSSEGTIKRQIEGELAWSRLLRNRVSIEISDTQIEDILKRMEQSKGTDEYRLFEIYLNAPADRASEVVTGEQRMIQQLREGTPFEYLARTYSEASTRATGGDLGWIRLDMLPDQLAGVARSMNVGEVAGPIEVPGGYSILYLADKHQVLTADPRDAVLSLKQIGIKFPDGTTQAQAETMVGRFAEAAKTIQGCGDAGNFATKFGAEVVNNDSIKVRDLPAPLQNMILPLQIGQTTQPFGSMEDGVRVLVICGRDDPKEVHGPSADDIRIRLEDERTNLRAQRMLRDLRRDALVEYR